MKKKLLLSSVAMSTVLLFGCMDGGSSVSEYNDDGDVIVTVGNGIGSNPKLPEGDTYEDNAYTRLLEKELEIEIINEFEAEGEDYDRQVALATSSGEMPHTMGVSEEELKDLYESDLIADISDVFDEYASDYIKELYNSYDVNPLDAVEFDGGMYGIPHVINVTPSQMVWIRQDWLEELNIYDEDNKGVLSLAELEDIAKTFMLEDPGNTGKPVGISFVDWLNEPNYGGTFTMTAIASVFEAYPKNWIEDENGKITNGSLAPEMKDALEFLKGWFDEGILDPQYGTRSWDDIMGLAVSEQTGIVTGAWHMPDWGLNNVYEMNPEAVFKPYVIVDEDNKINIANMDPKGSIQVVSKDFKHPELIIEMVNILYDDIKNESNLEEVYPEVHEYQALAVDESTRPLNIDILSYSSELDDYAEIKRVVTGEAEIDDLDDARNKTLVKSISEYDIDSADNSMTSWSNYHSRMKGLELGEYLRDNNFFNWKEPIFFGKTPAIEQYGGNLGSMEDEEFVKIITGEEPIEHFDTFVEMWHEQGGNEILSEIKEELNK